MQISYLNYNLFFILFPIYKTEESKDCYVDVDVLFRRRRKTEKNGKEKGGKYSERDITFFWRRKAEREKEENIWKWSLQNLSRIFRSLSFGLETFANFWRVLVSVSENLVSEKSLGFGFRDFGLRNKVSVSVSENLVSEKNSRFGIGKFGLGKGRIKRRERNYTK